MLELTFKDVNKCFIKSSDKSSELKEGKLIFSKQGLTFNNRKVKLEKVEKDRSFQLCYMRLEIEDMVVQVNVFIPKRKQKKASSKPSLI